MHHVLICVLFVEMLWRILLDIVLTHVNVDVVEALTHPLVEPSMVQRWSQVLILFFDLLRLWLVKQGGRYHLCVIGHSIVAGNISCEIS